MKSLKYLLLACFLCCLLPACQEKSGPMTPEKLFDQYRKSVVLVRTQFYLRVSNQEGLTVYMCDNGTGYTGNEAEAKQHPFKGYGTGFFISKDGKIATNRHVVFPEIEGKEMFENLKPKLDAAAQDISGQTQALEDSIAEISNYIEEHADQISPEEMQQLTAKKEAIREEINTIRENDDIRNEELDYRDFEITAVPVAIGIAYDNTSVGNNDSYHPCSVLQKSNDDNIDLAILQLKDQTTPATVEHIFTFDDQNPNNKNGMSDSAEAYNIDKQLKIDKKLYLIGYNYGEEMANTSDGLKVQFTQGTVSQESDAYKVLYSIPALPGSSGSPVIDQWGNLVAINYAGVKNAQSFNYGILARHLKALVTGNAPAAIPTAAPARYNGDVPVAAEIDYETRIREFIGEEAARNFEGIFHYFSPNIRRYWDLKNPTKEQLRKRYERSWSMTTASENQIQRITRTDRFTFNVRAVYVFTNNNGETKQLNTNIRFEFDAYGNIVETYGL